MGRAGNKFGELGLNLLLPTDGLDFLELEPRCMKRWIFLSLWRFDDVYFLPHPWHEEYHTPKRE